MWGKATRLSSETVMFLCTYNPFIFLKSPVIQVTQQPHTSLAVLRPPHTSSAQSPTPWAMFLSSHSDKG